MKMMPDFMADHPYSEFVRFGKIFIFILLILVEVVLAFNNSDQTLFGINVLWVIVPAEALLTAENAVKNWGLWRFRYKMVCYVLDNLLLLVLTCFTNGTLISSLYIVILTEFYFSQERFTGSVVVGASSVFLFLVISAISRTLKGEAVNFANLFASVFSDLLVLFLHFLIINFTLQIYRKNVEVAKAVEELNETNEKLIEANAELRSVAALEERQRIAKDIHDTAGHSITTVIMQTEAAKLVIDTDPEDAKRKIVAANLQAKHALEELRESVHLLSGVDSDLALKDCLMKIIHESTDGTNVSMRYDVDDVRVSYAKNRFLCNTLKEGISNGLRHGNATAFWFELKQRDGKICFQLLDNGRGAEQSAIEEGLGISGMRKRAQNFGGEIRIETAPDEGFEIDLTLPSDETEVNHDD